MSTAVLVACLKFRRSGFGELGTLVVGRQGGRFCQKMCRSIRLVVARSQVVVGQCKQGGPFCPLSAFSKAERGRGRFWLEYGWFACCKLRVQAASLLWGRPVPSSVSDCMFARSSFSPWSLGPPLVLPSSVCPWKLIERESYLRPPPPAPARCHRCKGMGRVICESCGGVGMRHMAPQ